MLSVSAFNDWDAPNAESLVWFRNDENGRFTKVTLAYEPIQLLTLDAADFDGDGSTEMVSGGFPNLPPYDKSSRITLWKGSDLR